MKIKRKRASARERIRNKYPEDFEPEANEIGIASDFFNDELPKADVVPRLRNSELAFLYQSPFLNPQSEIVNPHLQWPAYSR